MIEIAIVGVLGGLGVICALAGKTLLAIAFAGGLGLAWFAVRHA